MILEEMKQLPEKDQKKLYEKLKEIRHKAKTGNFAMTYGAFPPRIAITANISTKEAEKLFETYWERNKAIKLVAEDCIVKTINDQMWLYNPVSKFWCSLRYEKDKFSTLNQGELCCALYKSIKFGESPTVK